jgi:D-glycero-D-manno-heptose 1,7-bisphosphate phosphatase
MIPLISKGNVYGYRSSEYVKDMGTEDRLINLENDIIRRVPERRNLTYPQRAVFIDRDGTINELRGSILDPEDLHLIEGTEAAIKRLNESGYLAICVTNQPLIARGEGSFETLDKVHARLDALLSKEGAYLDDLYLCPHHPDVGFEGERLEYKVDCSCRKPKCGLLFEAQEKYNIDLSRSYMIGDSTTDMACAKAAGCYSIGLKSGASLNDQKSEARADLICENLYFAIQEILALEGKNNDDTVSILADDRI